MIATGYKYENVQRDSIVHEGHLEYFYGENLFKIPLCKSEIASSNREKTNMLFL